MNYFFIIILLVGNLLGNEVPDQGLYFNGDNAYVDVPDHESLDLTESFTVEFWAKPDSLIRYGQILNKHQPGVNDDGSWVIKYIESETDNKGTISFEWPYKPNSTSGAIFIKDDFPMNWFHIAVCYNKQESNLSKWVNGEKKFDQKIIIQINDTDWPLYIGSEVSYNHFKGSLSEIRISSIPRYKDEFRPPASYLMDDFTLAYWPCNEGNGTVLKDYGHFANHGKMVNVEWLNPTRAKTPFSIMIVGAVGFILLIFFFYRKSREIERSNIIQAEGSRSPKLNNGKGVTIILEDELTVTVDGKTVDINGIERHNQVSGLLTLLGNASEFKLSHEEIKSELWPLVIDDSFVNSLNVTLTATRKILAPYENEIIHQAKMVVLGENIKVIRNPN